MARQVTSSLSERTGSENNRRPINPRPTANKPAGPNQVSTKRGFPVYRTNPSMPRANGITTRTKRIHVPGGKAAVIVDNTRSSL